MLFRGGEQLENAYKTTAVVFDKTGTVTYGAPEVTRVFSVTGSPDDIQDMFILSAAVERLSEHPVAGAVTRAAAYRYPSALPPCVDDFRSAAGQGVSGLVAGREVICGNRSMLSAAGVDLSPLEALPDVRDAAETEVCVAREGVLLGVMGVADRIKPEAPAAVEKLKKLGIEVWLLTGDNGRTAAAIGSQAGIELVMSEVPPEKKAEKIKELQAHGKRVCMVGDGINDAPALSAADTSIAMGGGTDVAIDASDVLLPGGNIDGVPLALYISRATMRVIKSNLLWALLYNIVCIPMAACGIINPSIASAAMSFSSIAVMMNSLRLKHMGEKKKLRSHAKKGEAAQV